MRYEYFDCQLLSDWSIGPLQEFTTKCYALQDEETVNKPGGTELIPTVTAFVPSLSAGLPFYVSIQSWIGTPQPTLQSPHIPVESIAWEARLFIDGKLVAHTEIGHEENWPITMEVRLRQPNVKETSLLEFPPFHKSLLHDDVWAPGDTLGRIKVIISEGFIQQGIHKGSAIQIFHPCKNIVAFAFQHAPLELLKARSIAYPNTELFASAVMRSVPDTSTVPGSVDNHDLFEDSQPTPRHSQASAHKRGAMLANARNGQNPSSQHDPLSLIETLFGRHRAENTKYVKPSARQVSSDYSMHDPSSDTGKLSDTDVGTCPDNNERASYGHFPSGCHFGLQR